MVHSVKNNKATDDYSVNPHPAAHGTTEQGAIDLLIPEDYAGLRLDQALAKLLPDWSRSRLQMWITENLITLDGRPATVKQKVWGNERVRVLPQETAIETAYVPEAIHLDIIHEDDSLIVINKPSGLVTHPGNGNWRGTLLNALLYHAPKLERIPRAGIVHRLDKDTSGLLVVAKTLEAQTNLVRQLQQRTVKRDYMALVLGNVTQPGVVDAPIGRHPIHRTRMAVTAHGKPARTHYQVIEKFPGCTLLLCSLETGRTHQIRVHLQNIGYPLAGDPVYGGKLQKTEPSIGQLLTGFPRQALHAWRLALLHPETGYTMQWEAFMPGDITQLLQTIRQFAN